MPCRNKKPTNLTYGHAVSETNTKRTTKLLMRTPSIPSLGHTQFPNGETPVLSRGNSSSLTGGLQYSHGSTGSVPPCRYSSTYTSVLQYLHDGTPVPIMRYRNRYWKALAGWTERGKRSKRIFKMSISDLNIVHTEYTEYTEWFIDDNTTNKRNHRICRKPRYDGWRDEDKITERKSIEQ